MLKLLPIFVALLVLSDSLVKEIVNTNIEDYHLIYHKEIDQEYFSFVSFYGIDNRKVISSSPWDDSYSKIIAIDSSEDFYKIHGFEVNEFNRIIEKYPVKINIKNAYQYGTFFINLKNLNVNNTYYFISDVDSFVTLNKDLYLKGYPHSHPQKSWDEEMQKIKKFLKDYKLKKVLLDTQNEYILSEFYYWEPIFGRIQYMKLKIGFEGKCHIIEEQIIAKDIGYWRKQHS